VGLNQKGDQPSAAGLDAEVEDVAVYGRRKLRVLLSLALGAVGSEERFLGRGRYLTRFVLRDATLKRIVDSDLVFLLVLVVLLYSQTTPTLRFSGTLY
jgi:hypothetical protein